MIPGLALIASFIDPEEEASLLARIDDEPWDESLSRRVQHYGYRYDYKARSVAGLRIGPLPDWVASLAERVGRAIGARPDQLIVNEYQAGQGISRHIDCVPCFGPTIASLSLGGPAVMRLTRPADEARAAGDERLDLPPRSLLLLRGEARYDWRHAIPARRSDPIDGRRRPRLRRVSLTFRTVLLEDRGRGGSE